MSLTPSIDDAPEHVKLAVDLIYLLESNEISPHVALEALEIVQSDLKKKIESSSNQNT